MQDASTSLLVFIPFPIDIAYAIARCEQICFEAGRVVTGDATRLHFAYTRILPGRPRRLQVDASNLFEFDPRSAASVARGAARRGGRHSGLLGVRRSDRGIPVLRRAGVRSIVFYSGQTETRKGVDVIVRAALDLVERTAERFPAWGRWCGSPDPARADTKKCILPPPAPSRCGVAICTGF